MYRPFLHTAEAEYIRIHSHRARCLLKAFRHVSVTVPADWEHRTGRDHWTDHLNIFIEDPSNRFTSYAEMTITLSDALAYDVPEVQFNILEAIGALPTTLGGQPGHED